MSEKEKQDFFLVNDRECFALSHFTCICFFNCQSCKFGQLSHNYTKRDFGNPNFSSTAIVYHFSVEQLSCLHIQTKVVALRLYTSRTYGFTYSYIFIFISPESSYRKISKFAIWFHKRNIISSWDFYLELRGI